MTEPIRWVQTNLRETDANLDPNRLSGQLADMRANVLLMGMGGIAAYYPTTTEFHYASPYLPAGKDLFGEVLRQCHAKGIRVVGRFDFSKTRKTVFEAHPGMVLPEGGRFAGHLQQPLFNLHKWRLLPAAGVENSDRRS